MSMLPVSFSAPASSESQNEDALRVGPGLAVVVDGAGVEPRFRAGCVHSVAWFANQLADAMLRHLSDRSQSPREALARSISHVREQHGPQCHLADGSPSATIAAFRVNGDRLEHLVQCDAAVLLVRTDGSSELVTDRMIEEASAKVGQYREELRGRNLPEETVAEMGEAYLERLRNDPAGFWIPQDDPAVADHALAGSTPVAELRAVVACSDGITRALDRLGLHEVDSLACAAVEQPLEDLVTAIRTAESDGRERPGKLHDDATVAVLHLG